MHFLVISTTFRAKLMIFHRNTGHAEDICQLFTQENAAHSRNEQQQRCQSAVVCTLTINDVIASISTFFVFFWFCDLCRTVWSVWRTLLEETDKLAKAKLAIVEVFQQQIADDAKTVRQNKMQLAKKVLYCSNKIIIIK